MQFFSVLFFSQNALHYFTLFLRPSSEAQNCTHSIRYLSGCNDKVKILINIYYISLQSDKYLTLCVQICAPDDGRRNRLKHVQRCSKWNQRDAVQQVFYCTLVGSTCFGCRKHQSSGAQYVQSRSAGSWGLDTQHLLQIQPPTHIQRTLSQN